MSSDVNGSAGDLTKKVKTPALETPGSDGDVAAEVSRADCCAPAADPMRARASDTADDAPQSYAPEGGPEDLLFVLSEPKTITEQRFAEAEEMLSRGMSARSARGALARKHGVTRIHAAEWVRAVHERWQNETPPEERLARRQHLRETGWHGIGLAFARKGMALDKDGIEHYFADPDVGAARGLLEFLARLDGVLELETAPIQVTVTIEQRVEAATVALRTHYGLGAPALQPGETQVIDAPAEDAAQKASK